MMKIKVLEREEQLLEVALEWQNLHLRSINPELCNSWEWLSNWWNIFKEKDWALHVICVYNAHQIVAIAPYYMRSQASSNVLCLMGRGEPEEQEVCSEFVDYIVDPKYKRESFSALESYHLRKIDLIDKIELRQVLAQSMVAEILSSIGYKFHYLSSEFRYELSLKSDLRSTLKSIPSKNLSKKTIRFLNQIEAHRYKVNLYTKPDQFDYAWEKLKNLHNSRWSDKGKKGAFLTRKFCEFHKACFCAFSESNKAKILTIEDERFSASIYCFYVADRIYYYQSGFASTTTGSWGAMSHVALLDATADEFRKYDFMCASAESYKSNWTEAQSDVYCIDAFPSNISGNVRYVLSVLAKKTKKLISIWR